MRFLSAFLSLISVLSMFCCKSTQQPLEGIQPQNDIIATTNSPRITKAKKIELPQTMPAIPDTTFVDLKNYSQDFVYDMKYATDDNFLKSQVYDCAECYLRLKTVEALIAANSDLLKIGYKIKIYDCYRPLDIQKKMWKIVSNPSYVANPKTGSVHNRGGAVDISLVDSEGNELDMGTKFDHFGPEAAIDYAKLSTEVQNNRTVLKEIMAKHGFSVLKSEWWHFNFAGASQEKVSNFKWDCN